MKYFLVLIILSFHFICKGQSSYLIDSHGNIYTIDIANNCAVTQISRCSISDAVDIAIDPSGKLYICNSDSLLSLDISNPGNSCTFLGRFVTDRGVTGLVAGPDGNVYASGQGLTKYDPVSGAFTYLGDFPPGVFSAGDMVVYNNHIYLAATNANIYEIDISNPSRSTLFYQLGIPNVFGLMVVASKCFNDPVEKPRVIAFEQTGAFTSRAYLIDMENKISFPDYCRPAAGVFGSASLNTQVINGGEISISNIKTASPSCNEIQDGSISITMTASAINIYSFSVDNKPTVTGNTFNNLSYGPHSIRVKNQFGCYTDTIVNIPEPLTKCKDALYVPTIFTPNDDGLNDIFRAISYLPVTNFEMRVFNRYGQTIFQSSSITKGWDGKLKAEKQPSGVYVWWVKYTSFSGRKELIKGSVALIR